MYQNNKHLAFPKAITTLVFCLALLAGLAQPAPADTNLLTGLRKIKPSKNFLPDHILVMVQDAMGFVWISTDNSGLFRFDGKNLKQYTSNPAVPNSIASNSTYLTYQDSRNRFWLFYQNGQFDIFDPLTEKIRHFSAELSVAQKILQLKGKDDGSFTAWHARSVYEDAAHRIWLVADSYVAVVNEAGRGSIRFFVNAWPGIPNRSIESINETPSGNLLVVTTGQIAEVDAANHIVRRTLLPVKTLDTTFRFYNSKSIRKGDTLYAAYPARLVLYSVKTGQIALQEGLPNTCLDVKTVVSPANDRFLFYDTAKPNHLYSYVIGRAAFEDVGQYLYYAYEPTVYKDKLFYLYDRFGTLWHAASYATGISYGSIQKPPFIAEKFTYDPFFQFYEHLLHIPEAIIRQLQPIGLCPIIGNPHGEALYINAAHRFSMCIPAPYGTNRIKAAPRWTVNRQGDPVGLVSDDIWRNGKLWLYDGPAHTLFTIDTLGRTTNLPIDKLPERAFIYSLSTTGNNRCWFSFVNKNGLGLYEQGKGFIKYVDDKGGKMPLPPIQLKNIVRDKFNPHIFWITTHTSGLLRFNEQDETWQLLTEKDGFPSNTIYNVLQDRLGYIWYNTQFGIYRLDTRRNVHQRIVSGEQLGNPDMDFAAEMGHLLENEIYFNLNDWVIAIKTDSIQPAREVAVALTGIGVNEQMVEAGDSSRLMPVAANALSVLKLGYNQNFLHFYFAALEYNQPGNVQYRYQMQGLDKGWVVNGANREAQYTSLPPGDYTFSVNATNEDGNWSNYVKTLEVIISPPWWRTWWMYALYILLLGGAIYFFISTRLRRLQLRQQVVLKQKEAEQAQVLEETKSRFFANITHELRTPLTLILSPVQRQLQQGADGYTPLLKGVYQNSQTLLRLINQLLDMSKLEGGNMPVTLSRGDIGLFIDNLLKVFSRQAQEKNITLTCETNNTGGEYMFDSDKLEKVVYNLLSNAFKFTPEGGEIRLVISRQLSVDNGNWKESNPQSHSPQFQPEENMGKDVFQIKISDSGIGITPEHLPHIFNRFYQVNTSTTRRYEGTGIGLSLVKEFVDLMGGKIIAESISGTGSTFTLTLPLAMALGNEPVVVVSQPEKFASTSLEATPTPLQPDEGKPLVLVVDDNEQLRHFIQSFLQPNYRVLTAANGEEGLQIATTELPELIISDVMMPVMDGYEFCQKVKENPLTSHIGFILLTAKMADESRVSGLRLGADHYLGKPFIVEELLLVAGNLLKRQQQLRNLYSEQLQQPGEKLPPVSKVEDPFLQKVYTIIENNLDSEKLDVEYLANELAVSRRTLNRKLATVADTSANELIRNYRLKKAARLLQQGETVSNAAYATGFSTPSYFSQCFKEMYGITPVLFAENGGMSQN